MRKLITGFLLFSLTCYSLLILANRSGPPATPLTAKAAMTTDQLSTQKTSRAIALTFDDGPNPVFTPQIEHVLQRFGVSATFFWVGENMSRQPALVRQTFQSGNEIDNHSWSHPDLTRLSRAAVETQLRKTSAVIEQTTGSPPAYFRPPYGATNITVRQVASQLGMQQVLWTIDTSDWRRPGVETIVHAVLVHAQSGSIVLLHDGGGDRSETVQALPEIISDLRARGFTLVTMKHLLGKSR